jgi:protein-S-isoprenylcysteine O-methyltransferase Ste14
MVPAMVRQVAGSNPKPSPAGREPKLKTLLVTLASLAVLAALLFGPAGTLGWPAAWAFLAILAGASAVIEVMLLRHDPALLSERLRFPIQSGQARWDKLWIAVFVPLFLAWLPLMGLDAVRLGWSHVPLWLQGVGGGAVVACFYISYLVYRENSFLAPVVKLQADRGQHVVSTGPYAHVRHPLYAAAVLFLIGTALLLGSWSGLAGAVVLVAALALRAVLEERMLAADLPGYAGYMRQVKYRLVPGVW